MSKKRLSMRKIEEVLRLKFETDLSHRKIATSCGISRSTVSEYLARFDRSGLGWLLQPGMDEAMLEQALFPTPLSVLEVERPLPDWCSIHKELKMKCKTHVTLFLLWQEYRAQHSSGYNISGSEHSSCSY